MRLRNKVSLHALRPQDIWRDEVDMGMYYTEDNKQKHTIGGHKEERENSCSQLNREGTDGNDSDNTARPG